MEALIDFGRDTVQADHPFGSGLSLDDIVISYDIVIGLIHLLRLTTHQQGYEGREKKIEFDDKLRFHIVDCG